MEKDIVELFDEVDNKLKEIRSRALGRPPVPNLKEQISAIMEHDVGGGQYSKRVLTDEDMKALFCNVVDATADWIKMLNPNKRILMNRSSLKKELGIDK